MAEYTSSSNTWVEHYLTALLGDGLSKEYSAEQQHQHQAEETKALYFLNKLVEDDEVNIVHSWRRAHVVRVACPFLPCRCTTLTAAPCAAPSLTSFARQKQDAACECP